MSESMFNSVGPVAGVYSYMKELTKVFKETPEDLMDMNLADTEAVEGINTILKAAEADESAGEDVIKMLNNFRHEVLAYFYASITFAAAAEMRKGLLLKLSEVPSAEGEAKIAEYREALAKLQASMWESGFGRAAKLYAALQGDAKFVTDIDFTTVNVLDEVAKDA